MVLHENIFILGHFCSFVYHADIITHYIFFTILFTTIKIKGFFGALFALLLIILILLLYYIFFKIHKRGVYKNIISLLLFIILILLLLYHFSNIIIIKIKKLFLNRGQHINFTALLSF